MSSLVTFGETMLRFAPPDGERIETADTFSVHVGGAASNVAVAAARLGVSAAWLSKLVDSPLGRRVQRTLQSHGVQTDVAWTAEGRVGTYYLEVGHDPRRTAVVYDREHTPIRSATAAELATERLEDARVAYLSGITPALSETLAETTATLLETARTHDTTTVLDVNYRSALWEPSAARSCLSELLPAVDLLVIAQRDAETVFGHTGTAEAVGRTLKAANDHDLVIVTRGARGAVAVSADGVVDQPAFDADTVDPVGAGDALVGGVLARRLDGASVATALEYGVATAALQRTIRGDIPVLSPTDVAAVIEAEDGIAR